MKMAPPFEIKVALLGNVSAGKSTVLNALLRDKYSEVAMKRTTAGVNYFSVYQKPASDEDAKGNDDSKSNSSEEPKQEDPSSPPHWNNLAEDPHSAEATLKIITEDNRSKLSSTDSTVQEKHFDVELDPHNQLVEMRADTKLVLVDVPGLNEAGAFDQYKKFVCDKWHTFDCVVVVMDAKQGVNTQDQVFLLGLVKDNLARKKQVPVIILCNKVDDPQDEEQAELVDEARAEVEKIFGVECRKESLRRILEQEGHDGATSMMPLFQSPAFIPISAISAYTQLSASQMSLEKFTSFDNDLIEKLGREQIGRRRWNKLTEEEKIKEVYNIVTNPEECQEVFNESNFSAFLGVLEFFLGKKNQLNLLKNQIQTSTRMLATASLGAGEISNHLRLLNEQWKKVHEAQPEENSGHTGFLLGRPIFWKRYRLWDNEAMEKFDTSWRESKPQSRSVARPMIELMAYYDFVCSSMKSTHNTNEESVEKAKILCQMQGLVRRYLDIILLQQAKMETEADALLEKLSPYDWSLMFESILLLAHDRTFCETFGLPIVLLRARMPDGRGWIAQNFQSVTLCPSCKSQMVLGTGAQSHVKTCTNTTCVQQFHFRDIDRRGNVRSRSGVIWKFPMEWLGVAHIPPSCKPVPVYPEIYDKLVKVSVPASYTDPDHFGHLPWLYCQFMDALQEDENESGGIGTHLKKLLRSLVITTPVAETAPSSGFDFGSKSEGAKDTAAGAPFGSGTVPSGGFSFGSSGVATQPPNTPARSNQDSGSTASVSGEISFSIGGGATASAPLKGRIIRAKRPGRR